ncbi:hypothetical protein EV1_029801 [Malus domestica]
MSTRQQKEKSGRDTKNKIRKQKGCFAQEEGIAERRGSPHGQKSEGEKQKLPCGSRKTEGKNAALWQRGQRAQEAQENRETGAMGRHGKRGQTGSEREVRQTEAASTLLSLG